MAHMANNTLQYASLSPANVYSGVDESGERESVEGVCDMFAQFKDKQGGGPSCV